MSTRYKVQINPSEFSNSNTIISYKSPKKERESLPCPFPFRIRSKSSNAFRIIFELEKKCIYIYTNIMDECWCCPDAPWLCPKHDLYEQAVNVVEQAVQHDLPQEVQDRFKPYESLYELTLTTDVDDPYELRQSLQRIVQSKMFGVKGFIAVIELTKAGLPHIHALLFSNRKYIDGTKIKTLYKKRYSCKRVRQPDNYYQYINKERCNQCVIDYCALKGIPQLWEDLIN